MCERNNSVVSQPDGEVNVFGLPWELSWLPDSPDRVLLCRHEDHGVEIVSGFDFESLRRFVEIVSSRLEGK